MTFEEWWEAEIATRDTWVKEIAKSAWREAFIQGYNEGYSDGEADDESN